MDYKQSLDRHMFSLSPQRKRKLSVSKEVTPVFVIALSKSESALSHSVVHNLALN